MLQPPGAPVSNVGISIVFSVFKVAPSSRSINECYQENRIGLFVLLNK